MSMLLTAVDDKVPDRQVCPLKTGAAITDKVDASRNEVVELSNAKGKGEVICLGEALSWVSYKLKLLCFVGGYDTCAPGSIQTFSALASYDESDFDVVAIIERRKVQQILGKKKQFEDSRHVVNHFAHSTSERQYELKEFIPTNTFHCSKMGMDISQNPLLTPIRSSEGHRETKCCRRSRLNEHPMVRLP
ncbi:uncharacterized protein G2W53_028726 [Senna tora]|uniref:Uncharacterized protein n=1 Tax=Senna tora TaxID=362788 RepID=A0A834T6F3_9FABA|nr:uncharacterized protein G2W53_028726 [Senna tora]